MSKPVADEIRSKWSDILSAGNNLTGTDLQYMELDSESSAGPLMIAVDAERIRHFIVKIEPAHQVVGDKKSRGIQIIARELEHISGKNRYIDVVCLIPELNRHFDDVIKDMAEGIEADPGNPSGACRNVLQSWRRFLEGESQKHLSKKNLTGVFGELTYLKRLQQNSSQALELWKGYDKARHDFEHVNSALEIKASLRREGRACHINGVLQLQEPEGGSLMLGYLKLEESDGGVSVPELIESVIKAGVDKFPLYDKLEKIGYHLIHEAEYSEIKFRILEDLLYEVNDSFPRIIPSSFKTDSLPPGTSNLEYEIDLLGDPPTALPSDEIDGRLLAFVEG